jgi:threonine/homoserine/homoserine lactone efflux protein
MTLSTLSYSQNLWLFFVLLFGIIVVPGMDMLFVLTNALTGGRRAVPPIPSSARSASA